MPILDTSVLVRFITQDQPDHAQRAAAFLLRLQSGEFAATLPDAVLAETVFVLSSPRAYNVGRETLQRQLGAIIQMTGVEMTAKAACLRALEVYVSSAALSFVDALCVAYAERLVDATVVSFDRDFRRVGSISWEEP